MLEEASFEFRLIKIDETRNYLLDEMKHNDLMSEKYQKTCKFLNCVKHNDLMSEKYQKTCKFLNYVEHLLILA